MYFHLLVFAKRKHDIDDLLDFNINQCIIIVDIRISVSLRTSEYYSY